MKTLVRHGRAVLEDGIAAVDLLLEGERILALVPPGEEPGADCVLDATGCFVLPGFIDFHVHVDDWIGPFYLADTYESGSRVALQNGITTLCSFVTQRPDGTLDEALGRARTKAQGCTHGDLLWHLTPTSFAAEDWQTLERLAGAGYGTFKFYTTYKAAKIFADRDRLEEVFRRLGPLGVRFLVHCEDDDVMAKVDVAGLELSRPATHGLLRPEDAEVAAVAELLALAARTGVALHVVHVSTVAAVDLLLRAQGKQDVTFETCPQYLWLDETWLAREDGHRWLCSPPLRGDRERFRMLARAGAFDLLATDHCAFHWQDKNAWNHTDVRTAPNGVAGLGALPHLAWRLWENEPDRAALELAKRLSQNPARRTGLGGRKGAIREGLDADLVVLDPSGPVVPVVSTFADAFETYPGFSSRLSFRHVLLRGKPVVADGNLLHPMAPTGILLQPQP